MFNIYFKNNNFAFLRLFAAIQVVIHHIDVYFYERMTAAISYNLSVFVKFLDNFPGVPIFFLISGFLIPMSFNGNSGLKSYFKNRMLRIFPALYAHIIILIAVLLFFGFLTLDLDFFKWLVLITTIANFYQNDAFNLFGTGAVNAHFWTISVELQFYIVVPFLMYIVLKCSKSLEIGLVVLGVIISYLLYRFATVPYVFLPVNFFWFLLGFAFYRYFDFFRPFLVGKFIYWFLLYVVYLYSGWGGYLGFIYSPVKFLIFSFLIFSFAFTFVGFSEKVLKGSDYTYGIYLYHMLVINVFFQLATNHSILYFYIILFLSVAIGLLSWHLIEKPALSFKSKK